MALFKNANKVIDTIERFFNTIDQGVLVFKEGSAIICTAIRKPLQTILPAWQSLRQRLTL
ncbi:MAG: hypothetical protein MZV63_62320 [Marinilabiliales bacterium]|nr:hypothetical protein [Marinilabiliales bacterium]